MTQRLAMTCTARIPFLSTGIARYLVHIAACLSLTPTPWHLSQQQPQTWPWIRTTSGPQATFSSSPPRVSLSIPFPGKTADILCKARIVWAYTIGLFSKAPLTTFWYKGTPNTSLNPSHCADEISFSSCLCRNPDFVRDRRRQVSRATRFEPDVPPASVEG